MISEHLPTKIREHRELLKLTQIEAATLVGVSPRTWQNWEAGESFPWPRHRRALDLFFAQKSKEVAA